MVQKRIHFFIPEELLSAMDMLGGKGKRNNLVVEILDHEVRRRRLLQILSDDKPILKLEDHPEWKNGSSAWVRQMRDADDKHSRERLSTWLAPTE